MSIGTFAQALKVAMEQEGITAAELSRRTGLNQPYFSKLFNGKFIDPTWCNACLIIDALNISISDFKSLYDEEVTKQTSSACEGEQEQDYAHILAYYLGQKGMSPAELAKTIGSPRSTISALLGGRDKEPTLTTAKAIADALGVSLEEMASGSHEG